MSPDTFFSPLSVGSQIKYKGGGLFIGPLKFTLTTLHPSHSGRKVEETPSFDSPLGSPSLFLLCFHRVSFM